MNGDRFDVVVIGGGVAGMSTAARLQANGLSTWPGLGTVACIKGSELAAEHVLDGAAVSPRAGDP